MKKPILHVSCFSIFSVLVGFTANHVHCFTSSGSSCCLDYGSEALFNVDYTYYELLSMPSNGFEYDTQCCSVKRVDGCPTRAIPKLSFVSKLLERVVAKQLTAYLESNDLLPANMSACMPIAADIQLKLNCLRFATML